MLGTGCVLPCVMLALVFFVMPESPRWLVRKDRKKFQRVHSLLAANAEIKKHRKLDIQEDKQ